jgi:hypothetical protein
MSSIIWEMSDGDDFTTLEILEGRDLNREREEHAAMIDARISALEAENSALREDAAVGRAVRDMPDGYALVRSSELFDAEHPYGCYPLDTNASDVYINFRSETVKDALRAAGLMDGDK